MPLNQLLKSDINDVFLQLDDFSLAVDWVHGGVTTTIKANVFEEFQDFKTSSYLRLWCDYAVVSTITKIDFFMIDGDRYMILDITHDEHNNTTTIAAQKDK